MKQKTDLQIAQELKEEINYYRKEIKEKPSRPCSYYQKIRLDEALEEAKANLEGLGCGKYLGSYTKLPRGYKEYPYRVINRYTSCVHVICNKRHFCKTCLAKGSDKAKEIYEGILK